MKLFVYFCVLVVISLASPTFTQGIGFKEEHPVPQEQNAQNRMPYYLPGRCKDNEYLYPGDQQADWICDCAPGYLFHPDSDDCYLAFRQGPCDKGFMIVLGLNKVIPECIKNNCEDGSVEIKGKCYPFGESDICQPRTTKMLGVNTSTFIVDCIDKPVFVKNRIDAEDPTTVKPLIPQCPKGSKRFVNGKCK